MILLSLYLFIAFVLFFFQWKQQYPIMQARIEKEHMIDNVAETKQFWFMVLKCEFWIVYLPLRLLWNILELINNKFLTK